MAVLDHHIPADTRSEKRCVVSFCFFWLGFFVLIGAVSYLVAML